MSSTTVDESYDDADDPGGLSGFWILVIFLAVLAAFAGIISIAYQKGQQRGALASGDLPVVTASADPARVEVDLGPADPGRSEVIDELKDPTTSRVVAAVDATADPLDGFRTDDMAPVEPVTVPTRQEIANAAPTPTTSAPSGQRPAVAAPPTVPNVKPASTPTRTASPDPQPVLPARADPQPSASVSTPPAAAGTHAVQVGAFGSRDEAMEFYGSLMVKLGPLVGNQRPEVRVATVKGKDFHRLWLGSFTSREAAQSYCNDLSARGQACYVQKR